MAATPKYCVIDVETTGLSPTSDRVVEVAVITLSEQFDVLDAWASLVNPMRDVGPTNIHGIRNSYVSNAPRFQDLAPLLLPCLKDSIFVAHNARFDKGFIAAEFNRIGINFVHQLPQNCTLEMSKSAGFHPLKLPDCCRRFDIPADGWHGAQNDVSMTAALFVSLLMRKSVTPATSFSLPVTFRQSEGLLPRALAMQSRAGILSKLNDVLFGRPVPRQPRPWTPTLNSTSAGTATTPSASSVLSGARICFVPPLTRGGKLFTFEALRQLAAEKNFIVHANLSKNVRFLVVADVEAHRGRVEKARDVGATILSEQEFWNLVDGSTANSAGV